MTWDDSMVFAIGGDFALTACEEYGDEPLDYKPKEEKKCNHLYVWYNTRNGFQKFKCHECGEFRVI